MSGTFPPPPGEPPTDLRTDTRRSNNGAGGGRGYDRVPPHSLEAEVSVLGASLLSATAASDAVELLIPDDFYRNAHRVVFEAIKALTSTGEPVDTVTVTDWLARRDRLDEVGGAAAIHDLTDATPTAANGSYYARIVKDKALLRRLVDAGTAVTQLGYDSTDDARITVDRAESMIFEISQSTDTGEYSRLSDLLTESFAQIELLAERKSEVTGLATGFDDLDRLTAGLQPQNLIILAARPAMGKCLAGSSQVVDARSGRRWRLDELVAAAPDDVEVLSLDDRGRLVPVRPTDFVDNGVQTVVRLRTRSGRCLVATPTHPLRTWGGWVPIEQLTPGTRIAVPRTLPTEGTQRLADAEVILLAYLLGDGSLTGRTPVLTTASPMIEAEAATAAAAFGTACRRQGAESSVAQLSFRSTARRVTVADVASAAGVSVCTATTARTGSAPVATATIARLAAVEDELGFDLAAPANRLTWWLQELGVWGCNAHEKFVPDVVFTLPNDQVALFLSRLFATDGSAWISSTYGYGGLSYSSVSERLIHGVQHLLLRFGIRSKIRRRRVAYRGQRRPAFELEIRDAENLRTFLDLIGIYSKEEACARLQAALDERQVVHTDVDLFPVVVWERIKAALGDRSWADLSERTGRIRGHNWHVGKRSPSRRLVAEIAAALGDDELQAAACSDVTWDEVVSIEPAGEERVYDLTVPQLHNFVADDIVVHNSSLALGVSHFVSARLGMPSLLFSLEMSKMEIVNRLLSSEARIDSSKLRTGRLDDADWRKLSDALGTLSEAPLFIDDTPSISLMEIRAKSRRLKQKYGLALVVVDYLQLMQSHRRVDSRQQEVAEISRGLKMLAKELDVPVIALSQLSRQPESRTDKRPMLADLRESGCLVRGTRLFRADSGLPVTFGELVDGQMADVPVWAVDGSGRLVAGRLSHAFPSGRKHVFRVRLRSGMTVEASGNHPFQTLGGWEPLEGLAIGDRVAAARRLPEPAEPRAMDPDEIVLLAHLIGEGTTLARQPLHYTSADDANLDAVTKAAWSRFGITAVRRPDGRSARTTQLYLPAPTRLARGRRDPIAAWLDELGCWNRRAAEKRIPDAVFGLGDDQLRLFLHHVWATDGCLHVRRPEGTGRRVSIYYSTSSPQLARDMQLLLLRFDIRSRIRTTHRPGTQPNLQVWVDGAAQQRRFLTQIGVHGERGERVSAALDALVGVVTNQNRDDLPLAIWDEVRSERRSRGISERTFQAALGGSYRGSTLYRSAPSREGLRRVSGALGGVERFDLLGTDDRTWDEIVAIDPLGEQLVYDATVAEHHTFVAEGVVLHNSIEQDADIVGFIYRDEVYDEDTPDKGIAELIIAKHRNGATGIVKLAFLNHLTKFANLARGGGPSSGGPTPV